MRKNSTRICYCLFVCVLLLLNGVHAQVNISSGNTVTQNFDGMGTALVMPTGWRVDKSTTVRAVGAYNSATATTDMTGGAALSATATNGIYNFGSGTGTTGADRSVGGLSSAALSKSVNVYADLRNNGATTIPGFTLSYDVEKYRMGSNVAGFSMQLYYSLDGIVWTNAGSSFLSSFAADGSNSGYTPAPGQTLSVILKSLSVNVAAGAHLYLAWNYSVTTGATTSNAQALAVDNIQITAAASVITPILTLGTSLPAFGTVGIGSGGVVKSFSISGNDLDGSGISVAAPSGFSVSESGTAGTFNSSLSFSPGASFSGKTIFVKFDPVIAQSYNGNIIVSGGNASPLTIPATGIGSNLVPVVMSAQPLLRYTENFNSIAGWTDNFVSGTGANHFSGVAVNAAGTIPSATTVTTGSLTFSSGSSAGVQKSTDNKSIVLLSTGASPENSTSTAFDFYMDFTGVNAGTLSFDWASVNNTTGNRNGSLRVYASTDGVTYTELVAAGVLNFTNNVPSTGTVNSIALPASFNNSATARLRFYYHNGTGGTGGSRPKISIDNLIVTGVASTPCATPSAAPTSLTFGTITETSIQGNFVAASPAANEYLVIMSTNSTLTSNPLNGQSYVPGDNVGDGTVIAKGNELNFTATDLTGATTYYFFVFSVNSVCTGGPKYQITDALTDDATTVAGLPNCAAPAAQPTGLALTASINSIQGTFTSTAADEYLVLQSSSSSLSNMPVNGSVYNAGAVLGNATVVQRSNANTFTASALTPATQYYYYIFSVNSQACLNGPVYNIVSPLSGTATTQPLPVCVTPSAQPANLSFNSSNNSITATFNAAGSGYNYLVVMSSSPTLSATPVDNIDYAAGSSLGGGTVISNATSTSFIATSLTNSATYYFFVFSANKNCTGGTKYLVASPLTGNATTTNAPVNNYYFGNLHSHSDYSDGQKDHPGATPADAYVYASASLGMDFLGVSEHNHFSSLNNPGNELANYHLGVAQAAAFNATHSNFLALYGMEWGVISGGGHVLVYGDGMTDLFGWESNVNGNVGPNYDVYVPKNTYLGVEGLFKKVNDYVAKNTFASLAHPNSADFNNLSNIPYDQSADDAISGVAVESGPATSTNTTYSNPSSMSLLWYYNKLLSKGYHLGPMIDHDNHNTTFGRHTPARTAVIAPALTQSDIIKGVRDMHFYATEDMDAKVDFTINTRIMGSVFEDRNAPSIAVNLADATNSTSGALIRVMFGKPGSNILPVVVDSVFASSLSYVDNNLANHETGYYYVDITYGGKRIVTSPIWYTRTCASSSETTVTACDSYDWFGTLYTTSTVATKVFTTVGGCDSTVTLHLSINHSPSTATVALAGPGTGCPGTGVALTATADGSISSYQWLQDGNVISTTTNGNYTALASGGYSVRAVNMNNCSVVSANTISITVEDITAPIPGVATLPVITGQCSAMATIIPGATDNCAGTLSATTSDPISYTAQGTYTIHWVFSDGNGNSIVQEQTVIVLDNIAPVADVSVLPVITGQCAATVSSMPTATDNCAGTVSATTADPLSYSAQGTYTIHWSYDDGHGNTSTQEQTVIVQDNIAPVADASALLTITGECAATVSIVPTATDNCAGTLTATTTDALSYSAQGTYTIHWVFNDGHGNISTQEQTVIVQDNIAPVADASALLTITGECAATVSIVPTATDNCAGTLTATTTDALSYSAQGTYTVHWVFNDGHGNISTQEQTVIIHDATAPVITTPGNISVNNDAGKCGASIAIGAATATDNCGVASTTGIRSDGALLGADYPVGTTTITWTSTDIHGNQSTASQTVTVTDVEKPTITAPGTYYVVNTPGQCGATIAGIGTPVTADNCGVASVTNDHPSTSFPVGTTNVVWTVTDNNGWIKTATQTVIVTDVQAPAITPVPNQTFCTGSSSYSVPLLSAADNCGSVTIAYTITGATTRSGSDNNASGSFNNGVSTINWTVTDASGNTSTGNTTVTINALPVVTIAVSNADAFCNKVTLTALSGGSDAAYQWMSGSSVFAATQQVSLGQANGDGVYQVAITVGGCTSAATSYHFQKQNLVSSYTILAFDKVDLGTNNIVASGSVGVTSNSGEAAFGSNSSVSSPGSFVKAKRIDKKGSNIVISNPVYSAATGIALPTMFLNTAGTRNLPNKDVAQNSVSTVNGNYKNLTLKKGSRTTVTGNIFGTIRVEQGAQVTFTASVINIDNLQVVKGPRYGYSYVRFAGDAKVLVSTSVSIGSQVYINPDNNKVTFYMGDTKSDEEKFTVNGGDTKVTANIYIPNGKLKVTGGYSYGNYGNGFGDCDRDDDDDRYYGQGNAYVNMTGLFVAGKIEGNGKNVTWNSFDCSSAPVPVLNVHTQATHAAKEEASTVTTEEELKVTVLPNPSNTYFTLKIESKYETPVTMRVTDSRGRVVDTRSKLGSNSTIQIGHNYAGGVYYAEMIQGGVKKVVQLIKQK